MSETDHLGDSRSFPNPLTQMSQKLSRALTQILRHQAERYQLQIQPDGYRHLSRS